MSAEQQQINYGSEPNDGTGDPLRTAFIKTDDNFDAIWAAGPVGSNVTIVDTTVAVTTTNGNLVLKPNGIGSIQANASVLPNTANIRDLGSNSQRWRSAWIGTSGINSTGNVTAGYFVGNGSLLTGVVSTYGNANVAAYLDTYTGNISAGAVRTSVIESTDSSLVTIRDGVDVKGSAMIDGALSAIGNISGVYFVGNGSLLTGITSTATPAGANTQIQFNDGGALGADAAFYFDKTNKTLVVDGELGEHSAEFGIQGFTELNSNVIVQVSANANSYAQINFQNISEGNRATTDYVATAAFGTDSTYYVNMGIAGDSYDPNNVNNSLGTSLFPQDSYLYAQGGNTLGGVGGNLVLGSNEPGGVVRVIADGSNLSNVVATFSNTGVVVNAAVTSKTTVTVPVPLASLTLVSGAKSFASDANLSAAGNFGAPVAGGGANTVPVWSDGSNWYIG